MGWIPDGRGRCAQLWAGTASFHLAAPQEIGGERQPEQQAEHEMGDSGANAFGFAVLVDLPAKEDEDTHADDEGDEQYGQIGEGFHRRRLNVVGRRLFYVVLSVSGRFPPLLDIPRLDFGKAWTSLRRNSRRRNNNPSNAERFRSNANIHPREEAMKRRAVLGTSLRYMVLGVFGLASSAVFSAPFDLDAMGRIAAERGWETSRAADGSLLLYPAAPKPEVATVAEEVPTAAPADPLASLGERLAATGWRVGRGADGSLLLYPGEKVAAGPADQPRVAEQPSTDVGSEDSLGRLAGILNKRGWRTDRDSSGNLLLYVG